MKDYVERRVRAYEALPAGSRGAQGEVIKAELDALGPWADTQGWPWSEQWDTKTSLYSRLSKARGEAFLASPRGAAAAGQERNYAREHDAALVEGFGEGLKEGVENLKQGAKTAVDAVGSAGKWVTVAIFGVVAIMVLRRF